MFEVTAMMRVVEVLAGALAAGFLAVVLIRRPDAPFRSLTAAFTIMLLAMAGHGVIAVALLAYPRLAVCEAVLLAARSAAMVTVTLTLAYNLRRLLRTRTPEELEATLASQLRLEAELRQRRSELERQLSCAGLVTQQAEFMEALRQTQESSQDMVYRCLARLDAITDRISEELAAHSVT